MQTNKGFINAIVLLFIVVIAIGAVNYFVFVKPASAPAVEQTIENKSPRDDGDYALAEYTVPQISWKFIYEEMSEHQNPHTTVIAIVNKKEYLLGDVTGSCIQFRGGEKDFFGDYEAPGELSPRILCYYGGGGYEFGIFEEGTKLVAKNAALEEGSSEIAGGKGDFATILEIK